MKQRVHPREIWGTSTGLAASFSGTGTSNTISQTVSGAGSFARILTRSMTANGGVFTFFIDTITFIDNAGDQTHDISQYYADIIPG